MNKKKKKYLAIRVSIFGGVCPFLYLLINYLKNTNFNFEEINCNSLMLEYLLYLPFFLIASSFYFAHLWNKKNNSSKKG